jgi:hypothetical protein
MDCGLGGILPGLGGGRRLDELEGDGGETG